jgi:hypothetical protein
MRDNLLKKISQKDMTRKEFLQFLGGSTLVLFGFGNLIALMAHFAKTAETPKVAESQPDDRHGFGSRKFGA